MDGNGSHAAPRFTLGPERGHCTFGPDLEPLLTVPPGAEVEVLTREASDEQLTAASGIAEMATVDMSRVHPLTGPIAVETATPGDVLAVHLLEVEVRDWGWIAVVPGLGLLRDEFPEPALQTFRFEPGARELRLTDDVRVPLAPFPGVMGVAPAEGENLSTMPPRSNGGNMDVRYLRPGATVYFPVFVEGALFSIGDGHAVQGDGEVCGTALEAPLRVVLRFDVIKGGRAIEEPEYETESFYGVTAHAPTLDEAAKKATRFMIDYLVAERGLTRLEAYLLCSLAGDLKIAEAVNLPHVLVVMHLPKSVFG